MAEEIRVNTCFDVAHELEKASILLKTDSKYLTFDVLGVKTFLSEEKDSAKRELSEAKTREFFGSKKYEDPEYFISQAYDLLIKKKDKKQAQTICIELQAQESELILIFDIQQEAWILEHLLELKQEIDRKKVMLGVIFQDFCPDFEEESYREKILNAQPIIGQRKRCVLERSRFYSPHIEGHFFFTLKEEWEYQNQVCLENSSYATSKGMEVGRLYHAKGGSDGRNLRGEYIKLERKELKDMEFSALDEDFQKEEREDCVIYLGKREGFVGLNSSGLILIKETHFEEITHRNMGNLLGGKEIELFIKASSPEKDAIGAGIVIEAKKIHITGGVDQGAVLRSQECLINGFTHQNVEIYAKEANIGILKGVLKADHAVIKLCEGGSVDCERGEFEEMVGSQAKGKEIHVQVLHSNNKIYVSSKICIEEMRGGGNYFCIDSSAFLQYREEIDRIKKRHLKYMEAIEHLGKIYKQEFSQVKKMKPIVDRFGKIFSKNIQAGIRTQSYIITIIREYMGLCQRLKKIKSKMQDCQEMAQETLQALTPIAQLSLEGRIECHSAWKEENQVEYIDLLNSKKETLLISEGEKVNVYIDPHYARLIKERI